MHAEVYSLFIDRLVADDDKKKQLFNALEGMPVIKKKGEWAMKWSNPELPFAARLVAWSVVEGLLFASSFAAIAYFKHRGLLPGLGNANEFISRDESLHCKFAAETLYHNHIVNKLDEEQVRRIIDEAVQIEDEFVDEALPYKMIGMSAADMKVYVQFTANRLLQMLGCKTQCTRIPTVRGPLSTSWHARDRSTFSKSAARIMQSEPREVAGIGHGLGRF